MTSREIQSPESAIELIKNDSFVRSIADSYIAEKNIEFGNYRTIYNPRMFLALRNGHNEGVNSVMIYCMGGKVCTLKYNNGCYQSEINPTYNGNNSDNPEDIVSEIQRIRFTENDVLLFGLLGSFFYGLNPLCGLKEDLFLIDSTVSFAEARNINNFKIDYTFLKYVDGISHVLFIICKQAKDLGDPKNRAVFESNLQKYMTVLGQDKTDIIRQYNFVIDFYNKLGKELNNGCELKKLDENNSKIGLGFVIYYHQNNDKKNQFKQTESEIADSVIKLMEKPGTKIGRMRDAFKGCSMPFKAIGTNYGTLNFDRDFETSAINTIDNLANKVFLK